MCCTIPKLFFLGKVRQNNDWRDEDYGHKMSESSDKMGIRQVERRVWHNFVKEIVRIKAWF